MKLSKNDEKALKLTASMRKAGLSQKQIEQLVEEAEGNIVSAVLKGYNMGFLKGYKKGMEGKK